MKTKLAALALATTATFASTTALTAAPASADIHAGRNSLCGVLLDIYFDYGTQEAVDWYIVLGCLG